MKRFSPSFHSANTLRKLWLAGALLIPSVAAWASKAPRGTDRTITINEDATYTFVDSDFGFSDPSDSPANTLIGIKITTLPTSGTLSVDGKPVTVGQIISRRPQNHQTNWTPREENRSWTAVSSSANGNKLVALSQGKIYTSLDSGASWTARAQNRKWNALASSETGSKLFASTLYGPVYSSNNSGSTWKSQGSNVYFTCLASSSNGTRLVAADYRDLYGNGHIYTSYDSGVSWVKRQAGQYWTSVASSSDGTKFAATSQIVSGGRIYISKNSGLNWTARGPANIWTSIASSSDGMKLVAVARFSQIYTSTNSGETWTPRETVRDWKCVSSSADGTKLLAGVRGGQLHASYDSGVTWQALESNRDWIELACSADGSKAVAVTYGSQIFTSQGSIPVLAYTGPSDRFGPLVTNFTFQVQDSGTAGNNLDLSPNTLSINITPVNDAPVIQNPLADQVSQKDSLFELQIPENFVSDIDPDTTLSYTATKSDGSPLPDWLAFNPTTRQFSGVPSNTDGGLIEIKVLATDNGAPPLSAQDLFTITVPNSAPQATDKTITIEEDSDYIFSPQDFGFSDPNDIPPNKFSRVKIVTIPRGTLIHNGNELRAGAWITWAQLPELKFKPTANLFGSPHASFNFQVEDDGVGGQNLATSTNALTFNVTPVPDAPKLISPMVNISAKEHISFFYWASGYFDDPDPGTDLTFTTTLMDGSPLPSWLSLDSDTGKLTGTPPTVVNRELLTQQILVTATDNGMPPQSVSSSFLIKVIGRDEPPTGTDTTATLTKNSTYRLTQADFGFSDPLDLPAHKFTRVKLTTIPSLGTLRVDGVDATVGSFVNIDSTSVGNAWKSIRTDLNTQAVATSADGYKLASVTVNGQISTSSDGGQNWTNHESNRYWQSIASSSDGSKLVAVVGNGQIYTSTDYGESWTARATNQNWRKVVSSADGTHLAAIIPGGQIYVSSDSGISWDARAFPASWMCIASSADGLKLAAGIYKGHIYTSTDAGATWTARISSRYDNWMAIASSSDGTKLATLTRVSNFMDTSDDSGVTWTHHGIMESLGIWHDIASSSDGNTLIATGERIHVSTDSGKTWIARGERYTDPNSDPDYYPYRSAVVSADGSSFLATSQLGIYLSKNFPAQTLEFTPGLNEVGSPHTTFHFQVEDDGSSTANLDLTPNTLTLNVESPFALWASQGEIAVTPATNPIPNLLHFAFGTEPDSSTQQPIAISAGSISQRGAPTILETNPSDTPSFSALFGRRRNSGLTYTLQFSSNLTDWENSNQTPTVMADDGTIEACAMPFPHQLENGRKPRFFRVVVGD